MVYFFLATDLGRSKWNWRGKKETIIISLYDMGGVTGMSKWEEMKGGVMGRH